MFSLKTTHFWRIFLRSQCLRQISDDTHSIKSFEYSRNRADTIEDIINDKTDYFPPSSTPLHEIPFPCKNASSGSHDIQEFVDSVGPPLPIAFNLAAFVNKSESLQKLVQLGVDLSEIEKKADAAKFILQLDFEKGMKKHIQFLHDHGVSAGDLGRFITKSPFFFRESLDDVEVRVNYLKSKRFSRSAVARILSANPAALGCDTKTVDARLGFLQRQFALSGDELRSLVTRRPQLITYPFDKLREKLFIIHEELGFESDEMKKLLLDQPKMWMLSPRSLRERFNVVHNMMGIPHEEILKFPEVFLKREFMLKQRHLYLVYLSRAQYDPKEPRYVSLREIAVTSDAEFCSGCARTSVDEYNAFLRTL